ncbi:LLM class flavin-dependent oxidoreductase [Pseudonocardia sp. WMMC193]|uniref:LLM class flavin-dependent oxidoreductase n=1 Tax=Pseudonocardia sp. WMMC193 TaxID=2911965 RepID=UPI001F3D8AA1|nr:LLM class flavin-dependent oxidoreductase [Pseudonocardia sp. WMMC193]MCF7549618.1 LLM class flavin-dependent oxidoreductase [Pseudonocardia sp. WMMC193]
MITIVQLALRPDDTLAGVESAVAALEAAGVAAVCVLDGADTGEATAFESTTLCGRLASTTSEIGLVASNSALYGFPYHLARRLATVDHFSDGRSGWLLRTRTAADEAAAYDWRSTGGRGVELHRAAEYAEIALELWDSWEDGAQYPDKASGDYKDDARIHRIDYRSLAFRVEGPLDVPPSPQRRPVLFARFDEAAEAALLPSVDVAIVSDPTTAAAVTAPLILRAVPPHTTPDEAERLRAATGAHGLALHATTDTVPEACALAVALGAARNPGDTLAAALGLTLTLGGRAA